MEENWGHGLWPQDLGNHPRTGWPAPPVAPNLVLFQMCSIVLHLIRLHFKVAIIVGYLHLWDSSVHVSVSCLVLIIIGTQRFHYLHVHVHVVSDAYTYMYMYSPPSSVAARGYLSTKPLAPNTLVVCTRNWYNVYGCRLSTSQGECVTGTATLCQFLLLDMAYCMM